MPVGTAAGGQHRIRAGGTLDVTYASSIATVAFSSCQVLYDDGKTDVLQTDRFTMTTDRVPVLVQSRNRAKNNGWVFDAVVSAQSTAGRRGQTFIQLSVGPFAGGVLGRGYLYTLHDVCQDEFTEPGPGGGEGFIRTITGTNPAAGAEVLETVPTNAVWKIHAIRIRVVAGAAAFDGFLDIRDGADLILWTGPRMVVGIAATDNFAYNLGEGSSAREWTDGETAGTSLPDMLLPEGYDFTTRGITADDDYAAPQFQVEEWLVI